MEGYSTLSSSRAYYETFSIQATTDEERTYTVLLFIEHERSNGTTGVGAVTGLTLDTNGSTTNTKLVLGTGDSMRRGRHCIGVMKVGDN